MMALSQENEIPSTRPILLLILSLSVSFSLQLPLPQSYSILHVLSLFFSTSTLFSFTSTFQRSPFVSGTAK